MPPQAAADGHGLIFTYSGFVFNVIGVGGPNLTRDSIEKTHMGTVEWKEFMPAKLADAGEVSVEIEFDPQTIPPIHGPTAPLTIQWGDTMETVWECDAFITAFNGNGGETGARMQASVTFKLTGEPTVAA